MKTLSQIVVLLMLMVALGVQMNIRVNASSVAAPGWKLVWKDEFNGTSVQPAAGKWGYHVGNGWNLGANDFIGWGNHELEWYLPKQCRVQGGKLVIKAVYKPTFYVDQIWDYLSCRITTDTKFSLLYGAIEARIKMPNVDGTWPAFWMLGDACDDTVTLTYTPKKNRYDTMNTNWASCGEIDIVEHKNQETQVWHNIVWDTRNGLFPFDQNFLANHSATYPVADVTEFHRYRLEWTPTQVQWFVDDALSETVAFTPANMEEFQQPFHLIFNLAVGGDFAGIAPDPADFPATMSVDYVRVYKFTP